MRRLTLLVLLALAAPAAAQTPHAGTIAWVEARGDDSDGTLQISHGGRVRTAIADGAVAPAVSPGGTWVTAIDDRGLVLHRADGTRAPQRVSRTPDAYAAGWSADGRRFAFVEQDARYRKRLVVCDAEPVRCRRWITDDDLFGRMVMSPDGARVAYTGTFGDALLAVGADGRRRPLFRVGSHIGEELGTPQVWSAHGVVVDVQHRNGRNGVVSIEDGRERTLIRLPRRGGYTVPQVGPVAPDGRTAMLDDRGLSTIDLVTGKQEFLALGFAGGFLPDGIAVVNDADDEVTAVGPWESLTMFRPRPGRTIVDVAAG